MLTAVAVRVMLALPSPLAQAEPPNTDAFANWLRGLFGPLFLVIVGIVAIFFLFTREITRFVQFVVLALLIALIFYYPGLLPAIAKAAAQALGVDGA
ncbi:MAG TPA: hypothetical protein VKY91_03025 [Vulgatibacteraceae bacterium]|nr:hypothetical protein [Vulgatibacteraceae bacterium]